MKELEKVIIGRGESKGYTYNQLKESDKGYIYEVVTDDGYKFYEVFRRRENTMFDVISYPTSKSFGLWAWTYRSYEKTLERFNNL